METATTDLVPIDGSAKRKRAGPSKRGLSGAVTRRQIGARAVERLLEEEVEAITSAVIDKALMGDMNAARLCLERIAPARRDRRVAYEMPAIETAADALKASSAVLAACAAGTLAPSEAAEVLSLIATHVRMLEMQEIEARLIALEQAVLP